MTASAQVIFPGIYFEVVEPPVREVLPRMDIGAFVGYASSGPLHTPVPVEDAQRFRELFGADLELAWDEEHNTASKSCLGAAVDSFFRNGGRRCWVVRVADEELAQTASFEMPGLVRTNGTSVQKCYALARSPGSWSRDLTVNTVLQVTRFPLAKATGEIPYLSVTSSGWSANLVAESSAIGTGDMLRVQVSDGAELYLVVHAISATAFGITVTGTTAFLSIDQSVSSPPPFESSLQIALSDDFDGVSGDSPALFAIADFDALGVSGDWVEGGESPDSELSSVELLQFQWLANDAHKGQWKLDRLGFTAANPRFWGVLPSDELLFRRDDGRANQDIDSDTLSLIDEANRPRFPFCAAFADTASSHEWVYLPIGVRPFLDNTRQKKADIPPSANPLYLDGITNAGSRPFIDTRLEAVGSDLLRQEAHQIAYLSAGAAPLKGIHSLMTVEEATLIAVPDAQHRRWDNLLPARPVPLAAPLLEAVSARAWPGEYSVRWSAVDTAMEYRLQWSEQPDFETAVTVVVEGEILGAVNAPADLMPEPATDYVLVFNHDCARTYYFRVRAENRHEVSAWSNHLARTIPDRDFVDCATIPAELLAVALAVELSLVTLAASPDQAGDRGYWLRLGLYSPGSPPLATLDDSPVERLEIQRSGEHSFLKVDQLFLGSRDLLNEADDGVSEFFVEVSADTTFYYRARGFARNTTGPWSNTLIINPISLSRSVLQSREDFSDTDILAIHRALLRLCYARGDLFGVLCLPRHYTAQQARDHIARLNPGGADSGESITVATDPLSAVVYPLRYGESSVMSHGAVYYPWLASHTDNTKSGSLSIRFIPPDGAALGKIAAKSIEQGAWIAPANSQMNNVLALDTRISKAQWAQLISSRINVIREDSSGFLLLSADTLSSNRELSEISVRRLMSMLARLALREGNRHVFEPNNADLAARVQSHFESVFDRLYERGAFAGKNTAEAYRVVTDAGVNTRQSMEAGRFIVELHVAPSQPLKFIRIRLVQSGPNQLQVQEVS